MNKVNQIFLKSPPITPPFQSFGTWFWYDDNNKKWIEIELHAVERAYKRFNDEFASTNVRPFAYSAGNVTLDCIGDGNPTIIDFDEMMSYCSLGECTTCIEFSKENKKHNHFKIKRVEPAKWHVNAKFAEWAVQELLYLPYDEEAVRKIIAGTFKDYELEKLSFDTIRDEYNKHAETRGIDLLLKRRKAELKEEKELGILKEVQRAIDRFADDVTKELADVKGLLAKVAAASEKEV